MRVQRRIGHAERQQLERKMYSSLIGTLRIKKRLAVGKEDIQELDGKFDENAQAQQSMMEENLAKYEITGVRVAVTYVFTYNVK
jgi:hypothetical protein